MKVIDYLRIGNTETSSDASSVSINVVTNFTDGILVKIFRGILRSEGIEPDIFTVPYRQYHILLKDDGGSLNIRKADMTFMFFDINLYRRTELLESKANIENLLGDIERYACRTNSHVVLSTFPEQYKGAYGNLFDTSPLYNLAHSRTDSSKRWRLGIQT